MLWLMGREEPNKTAREILVPDWHKNLIESRPTLLDSEQADWLEERTTS